MHTTEIMHREKIFSKDCGACRTRKIEAGGSRVRVQCGIHNKHPELHSETLSKIRTKLCNTTCVGQASTGMGSLAENGAYLKTNVSRRIQESFDSVLYVYAISSTGNITKT